jgi:hypothetical protein
MLLWASLAGLFACANSPPVTPHLAESPASRRPSASDLPPPVAAAPVYYDPADFAGRTLAIPLPRSLSGTALVVIVPAITVHDFRAGKDLAHSVAAMDVRATALPPDFHSVLGHAIPPIVHLDVTPASDEATPRNPSVPETRRFKIYSRKAHGYRAAVGRKTFVGRSYIFFEDVRNAKKLSTSEYASISNVVDSGYARMTPVLGRPGDVDENGRLIVFLSRTAAEDHEVDTEGEVDPCNLSRDHTRCGGEGDIIYLWSLDGYDDGERNRAQYVTAYFPQLILHQTFHLLHYALAAKSGTAAEDIVVPSFYQEGPAEILAGPGTSCPKASAALEMLADKTTNNTPFTQPEVIGCLYASWLVARHGLGVLPTLLSASADHTKDPIATAVGVPEPLELALFYASLQLYDTEYGRAHDLAFAIPPSSDSRRRAARIPLRRGEERVFETSYTGSVLLDLPTEAPLLLTLTTTSEKAFVFVAPL